MDAVERKTLTLARQQLALVVARLDAAALELAPLQGSDRWDAARAGLSEASIHAGQALTYLDTLVTPPSATPATLPQAKTPLPSDATPTEVWGCYGCGKVLEGTPSASSVTSWDWCDGCAAGRWANEAQQDRQRAEVVKAAAVPQPELAPVAVPVAAPVADRLGGAAAPEPPGAPAAPAVEPKKTWGANAHGRANAHLHALLAEAGRRLGWSQPQADVARKVCHQRVRQVAKLAPDAPWADVPEKVLGIWVAKLAQQLPPAQADVPDSVALAPLKDWLNTTHKALKAEGWMDAQTSASHNG